MVVRTGSFLIFITIIVMVGYADIITGFNQLKVGNNWKYLYNTFHTRHTDTGHVNAYSNMITTVLIDSSYITTDTINYFISKLDEGEIFHSQYIPQPVDTTMYTRYRMYIDGNQVLGGGGFFTSRVEYDTATLLPYEVNKTGTMWGRVVHNGDVKDCYIDQEYYVSNPLSKLIDSRFFVQDIGLIFSMIYDTEKCNVDSAVYLITHFNGEEIPAEEIIDDIYSLTTGSTSSKEFSTIISTINSLNDLKSVINKEECTIKVYSTNGRLLTSIRTLSKIDEVQDNISSGLYLIQARVNGKIFNFRHVQ